MPGDYIFNNFTLSKVKEEKEEEPSIVMVHNPPSLSPTKPPPSWTVRRRSSTDLRSGEMEMEMEADKRSVSQDSNSDLSDLSEPSLVERRHSLPAELEVVKYLVTPQKVSNDWRTGRLTS